VHSVNTEAASVAAAETQTPIVHVRHQERYGAGINSDDLSICVCKRGAANDNKSRKTFVVYNGLDTQFWAQDEVARREFRDKHSIPEDEKVALWLGRVSPEKGPEHMVHLAKKLDEAGVYIVVVPITHGIVGYGEEHLSQVRDLQHAIIMNEQPRGELVSLYSAADFVVSTSRTEANPLVLIEGMLCRSIPVAFDVGGCPEIVFDCYNGFLVPHGNVDKMASSVIGVDDRSMDELKQNSRRMAERVFNKEQYVEQYERTYKLAVKHG
jgi:glycosyltransferase involved in cell wall biosynthesis